MVPAQQRSLSVVAPKVGSITSQRSVAANAKGAIKPMEATFTDFKLIDKTKKVGAGVGGRGCRRRRLAAVLLPQPALFPRLPSTLALSPLARLPRLPPVQQDWVALIAGAEFFFNDAQNEQVAENLRERVRYLTEKGQEVEMLFVCEPEWLDRLFPEEAKKLRRPAVALLCPDKSWMT
jgi:hypothetical protein